MEVVVWEHLGHRSTTIGLSRCRDFQETRCGPCIALFTTKETLSSTREESTVLGMLLHADMGVQTHQKWTKTSHILNFLQTHQLVRLNYPPMTSGMGKWCHSWGYMSEMTSERHLLGHMVSSPVLPPLLWLEFKHFLIGKIIIFSYLLYSKYKTSKVIRHIIFTYLSIKALASKYKAVAFFHPKLAGALEDSSFVPVMK